MGADLSTTNAWLAVLTIAVVIQTVGLIVAAITVARLARRVDATLQTAEAAIAPLSVKAHAALDELHALSTAARQAEQSIRETTENVGEKVRAARSLVTGVASRLWPVIGVARGVYAAASVFRNRKRGPDRPFRRETKALDEIGEARFVYEGGGHGLERP